MYTVIVPYSLIRIHINIYTIWSPNEHRMVIFCELKNGNTLCSDDGFIINLSAGHGLSSYAVKSKPKTDYAQCKFCFNRLFFVEKKPKQNKIKKNQ